MYPGACYKMRMQFDNSDNSSVTKYHSLTCLSLLQWFEMFFPLPCTKSLYAFEMTCLTSCINTTVMCCWASTTCLLSTRVCHPVLSSFLRILWVSPWNQLACFKNKQQNCTFEPGSWSKTKHYCCLYQNQINLID